MATGTDTSAPKRPFIQVNEIVREMNEDEFLAYLALIEETPPIT